MEKSGCRADSNAAARLLKKGGRDETLP